MIQDGRGQPNPYPWRERAARLVWIIVYKCFYRPVPRFLNSWHRLVLRVFGGRIGKGVIIYPSATIHFPWKVIFGDYCVVGDRVNLYSLGSIQVGRHTVVSQYAHLCAGTHDYTDPRMPLIRAGIVVGEGCWICTDVFVGPNVVIGDGCVVGARSVVVKDLPGGMVCAGNPCRPIKPRILKNSELSAESP